METRVITNCIPKIVLLGLVGASAYFIIICPCDTIVSCHLFETMATLGSALAIVIFMNLKRLV